jgi:SOS-response transcriptional repressor LexA
MIGLSGRQAQVYAVIRARLDANEPPPTLRELGERFGVSGVTMLGHVRALERKGMIVRHGCRNRNIRLPERCPTCGGELNGNVPVTIERSDTDGQVG